MVDGVKLIGLGVFIACWIAGGQLKGKIRDIPCPLILGLILGLISPLAWFYRLILGIATSATAQMIRLGYGAYDPENDPKPSFLAKITHDRGGWWIRALYGLLCASFIALPALLLKQVGIINYILYIAGNTIIGFCVSRFRFNIWLADSLVSAGFYSIIFL